MKRIILILTVVFLLMAKFALAGLMVDIAAEPEKYPLVGSIPSELSDDAVILMASGDDDDDDEPSG
jgi:hypothetical protein